MMLLVRYIKGAHESDGDRASECLAKKIYICKMNVNFLWFHLYQND